MPWRRGICREGVLTLRGITANAMAQIVAGKSGDFAGSYYNFQHIIWIALLADYLSAM